MTEARFLELPLAAFLEQLAAREPAPGGGGASAVAVAMAAALAAMAARYSNREMPAAGDVARQADDLRLHVSKLLAADASAYRDVLDAYRARSSPEVIKAALSRAADVPLSIAAAGAAVAELGERVAREGNPNLRGDAIASILLAEAATRAAAELVRVNLELGDIQDERRSRCEDYVASAERVKRGMTDRHHADED